MDQTQVQMQAQHLIVTMLPFLFLVSLMFLAIVIVPLWRICQKAGLSGFLALIAVIPGIGTLLALYMIAFSDWRPAPAPLVSAAFATPATFPEAATYPTEIPPAA